MKKILMAFAFIAFGTVAIAQQTEKSMKLESKELKVAPAKPATTKQAEQKPATKPTAVTQTKPIEERNKKPQKVRKVESSFVVPSESNNRQ